MGLWDYSRMESSSSIIYVSQIWAITLLIQIQLMEATSFSRNIMNADKVSHMERISPCTSHPRRGALVCMEITLSPARVSTCHCALKWVQALSWYKLEMKDVDKNFSYVSNDLWLFCLGTATGFMNKALGFGLANNSLEKQLQLDWKLWRKYKDQCILWISTPFSFSSWNVCGNM